MSDAFSCLLATDLATDCAARNPHVLEGTLQYLSPEQTVHEKNELPDSALCLAHTGSLLV